MIAFRLALIELGRFAGRPLRRLALVVLVAVPLAFGGLFLWSSWDPYGRADRIPVAVVNEDEGAEFGGRRLAAGAEFTAQLAATPTLGWHFVSAAEAADGMESGEYYFAIVVPADFSQRLAGLAAENSGRPHITVELDDANGYVATVMAQSMLDELQHQIDTAVYVTFAKSMFDDLTGLDDGLSVSAAAAMSLANGAAAGSDGAVGLNARLTELEQDSVVLADGIARLDGAFPSPGSRLVSHWPNIQAGSQTAADLTDGLSEHLDAAYEQLCGGSADSQGCADLDAALSDAEQISGSVTEVNAAVQDLSNDDLALAANQVQELVDAAELLSRGIGEAGVASMELADSATGLADESAALAIRLDGTAATVPSADAAVNAADADTLGSSVTIIEDNAHPAYVYGRGVAPVVFAIALWTFCLLAYLVLRPVNLRALMGRVSAVTVAAGGWLPSVLLGAVGVTVLYVVVDSGLGLEPVRPLATLAVAITAVAVFSAISQLLRFAFGALGGGALAFSLLALQVAAVGVHPIETAPAPIQVLHPLMPMTYLVDALRVGILGGATDRLWWDLAALAGFGLTAVVASTVLVRFRREWTLRRMQPLLEQ